MNVVQSVLKFEWNDVSVNAVFWIQYQVQNMLNNFLMASVTLQ